MCKNWALRFYWAVRRILWMCHKHLNIYLFRKHFSYLSIYGYKIRRWSTDLTVDHYVYDVSLFFCNRLTFIHYNSSPLSLIFDDECHSLSNAYFLFLQTHTHHTCTHWGKYNKRVNVAKYHAHTSMLYRSHFFNTKKKNQ